MMGGRGSTNIGTIIGNNYSRNQPNQQTMQTDDLQSKLLEKKNSSSPKTPGFDATRHGRKQGTDLRYSSPYIAMKGSHFKEKGSTEKSSPMATSTKVKRNETLPSIRAKEEVKVPGNKSFEVKDSITPSKRISHQDIARTKNFSVLKSRKVVKDGSSILVNARDNVVETSKATKKEQAYLLLSYIKKVDRQMAEISIKRQKLLEDLIEDAKVKGNVSRINGINVEWAKLEAKFTELQARLQDLFLIQSKPSMSPYLTK